MSMDQNSDPAIVEFWKDFRKEHGIGPNTWKEHMLCTPPTNEDGAGRKPEHKRSIVGDATQTMQDYQRALYGTSVQNNPGSSLAGLDMFGDVIVDTVTCKWMNVMHHAITVLTNLCDARLIQWYRFLLAFENAVSETAGSYASAGGLRTALRIKLHQSLTCARGDSSQSLELWERLDRYANYGPLQTPEERERDLAGTSDIEKHLPDFGKNINLKDLEK